MFTESTVIALNVRVTRPYATISVQTDGSGTRFVPSTSLEAHARRYTTQLWPSGDHRASEVRLLLNNPRKRCQCGHALHAARNCQGMADDSDAELCGCGLDGTRPIRVVG